MGWNEKVLGGRVPDVCAPRQLRKRAGLIRSNGSWTHCSQQVHGQECWQGPVPPSREAAPFSLSPYQQDALLRGRRSLQTGMRGAFGKVQGTAARIAIGQIMLSIRTKDVHGAKAVEAFRRAKFKFPGRQKIVTSRQWGFTKFTREDYVAWKQEGRIQPDGVNAKLYENHGRLEARPSSTLFLQPARVYKDRVEP